MVGAGKEIKRLFIGPKKQWQVIVLAPDEDSATRGRGGIRLVYWRMGNLGAPDRPESWEYGYVPYTVLEAVDAAPSMLLGAWFGVPPPEKAPEEPTNLRGFVEWHKREIDKVCGRCWVVYQVGAATQLAMVGHAAKSGPIQVEQGKTLTALRSNEVGTAAVLFRTGKVDAVSWSCKVVKMAQNGGIDVSEARALTRLKGQREVVLEERNGGIAAISVADASVSELLVPSPSSLSP